jgi:Flp pilus assembly protein TadG
MSRGIAARLRGDIGGSGALEFALAAMPMMLLIFGIIESGLLFWSWQALQGAAIAAARCAALNATSCQNPASTPANTQNYAVAAALTRGLSLAASNVTVTTGGAAQALCGNTAASVVSVALSYQFVSLPLVPLTSSLTASACFPVASG